MNDDIRLKAMEILRQEFGEEWLPIVQALGTEDLRRRVGKDLTSFMAFPERGEGGKNTWRGNCSPRVIEAVVNYVLESKRYYGKDIEGFTLLARCLVVAHQKLWRISWESGRCYMI